MNKKREYKATFAILISSRDVACVTRWDSVLKNRISVYPVYIYIFVNAHMYMYIDMYLNTLI